MPLAFEPQPGPAINRHCGITITAPSILPASPSEEPSLNAMPYMAFTTSAALPRNHVSTADSSIASDGTSIVLDDVLDPPS